MKSFIKFAKTSGIYFFGTVLAKLVTMLLLRVYTEYIPAEDMGTYNVSINYVTFLCSVLYLDIWSGILRYFYDYHTPEGQKKPINCGFAIFGISTAAYTVILVVFGQFVTVRYLPLIYLYGLMMNLQNLLGYVARAYGKNVLYASAGLLNSFVTAALNVVLIVGLHMDYSALYLAGCVGYLSNILLVGAGVKIWTLIRPSAFEKPLFVRMLRFSLPLCEFCGLLVSDQLQQCGGQPDDGNGGERSVCGGHPFRVVYLFIYLLLYDGMAGSILREGGGEQRISESVLFQRGQRISAFYGDGSSDPAAVYLADFSTDDRGRIF